MVHLTGVDTHEGGDFLGYPNARELNDGIFMAGQGESAVPVDAKDVAAYLVLGNPKPMIVTFNVYNSAARIAALTVAAGAEAAIGFQDVFDDELSDLLFAAFYHTLKEASWELLRAFQEALSVLPSGSQFGSGVVLWSARSLVVTDAGTRPRAKRTSPDEPPDDLEVRLESEKSTPLNLTQPTGGAGAAGPAALPSMPTGAKGDGSLRQWIKVDVQPHESLNYSLLHNNRGLFKSFTIAKMKSGYLAGVQVQVVLHVGDISFPYRTSVDLVESVTSLTDRVKVPLTSALARSVDESMHTSLYVEVTYQDQEIYRDTHRVTLLPVDEWRDDNPDRIWLPSFVLPRDPAVATIVKSAQRYLMALVDDPAVGFDGYQCIDAEADDPAEGVDLQVRALWSALTYDFQLNYINPAPSYSKSAQRLRTPSQVLDSQRGTCIDLALLLASCLEYVDIYPVIFLLKGHACAGYWRSDTHHQDFKKLSDLSIPATKQGEPVAQSPVRNAPKEPWRLSDGAYPEILHRVLDQQLVALETTWLTRRSSFAEALDRGIENLRSQADFDFLIDILLARQNNVTPLPCGDLKK